MDLQNKALQHVKTLLDSYEPYPLFSALMEALKKEGISEDKRDAIMKVYYNYISEISKPINEAKSWIEVIINNNK
jgi:hypothetical protein